jgi:hypothetical protein
MTLQVIQGSFEYPFSERQPPELLRSSNAETKTVMMQVRFYLLSPQWNAGALIQ